MRWSVVVLAVCGCGDNLTGTPLAEYDAEANAATCERLVRCGLFADTAACGGYFQFRPNTSVEAAIAAGVVRYDGALARQCHEALAARSCDESSADVRETTIACRAMLAGRLAVGAACAIDEECASGVCDTVSCQTNTCCRGTCHAFAEPAIAIDAACKIDRDCVTGAFCGKDRTCHALAGIGGLCDRDAECDYHLGCIGPTELMPGNCRAMPLVGESCPYLRCAETGAVCNASHVCVAVGLAGAPCTTAADCSPFATCDAANGVCADLPTLGMACTSRCAGEAWCDTIAQLCTAPRADEQPCENGGQCDSLFCTGGVVFDFCTELPVCF